MKTAGVDGDPLIDDDDRFVGVVLLSRLRVALADGGDHELAELVDLGVAPLGTDQLLGVALDTLTATPQTWATVIDSDRRVVGTIAISDVARS